MNSLEPWLVPLAITAFIAFYGGVMYLVSVVSGWRKLAKAFPAQAAPMPSTHETKVFRMQSGVFGWAGYNNCLTIRVASGGLYMSMLFGFQIAHPPIFIPWEAMRQIRSKKVWWHETVQFTVGDPKMATVSLPRKVFLAAKELAGTGTGSSSALAGVGTYIPE